MIVVSIWAVVICADRWFSAVQEANKLHRREEAERDDDDREGRLHEGETAGGGRTYDGSAKFVPSR
jgi:hypothetical protein